MTNSRHRAARGVRGRVRGAGVGAAWGAAGLVASLLAGCLAPDAVPGGGGEGGGGMTGGGGAPGVPTGYDLVWSRTYGADEFADKHALSVAALDDGGALVAGDFEGGLAFPPVPDLPGADGRDGFVAQLAADGTPQWSRAFSGFGDQNVFRALPAPGGGVLVAGSFTWGLEYGGMDRAPGPDGWDGFVALLKPDHSIDWLVRIGGPGDQMVYSMAVTEAGEVVVGGTFQSTLQIGDLQTSEKADGRDFFVAKLASSGAPMWGVSLGADPPDLGGQVPVCLVAAGSDGGIHVAGTFTGTVRLGSNIGAVGDRDVFVGKLTPEGKPVWGHSAGSPSSEQNAGGLAVSGAGLTVLSGYVRGQSQIDAKTTLSSDGPEPDAFLAVYGAAGDVLWARRYGSPAQDRGGPVAIDAEGHILFSGRFRGSIHFGVDKVLSNAGASAGSDDIFLATLTAGGAPLHAAVYGKADSQFPASLAASADGAALLAGWFRGIVDFGAGEADAHNGEDLFVTKLTPHP